MLTLCSFPHRCKTVRLALSLIHYLKCISKCSFPYLKGQSHNFLSLKSRILDSNGVWYCSFWSEGSINPLNLNILVQKFVPRDPEWQRTWDLKWRQEFVVSQTHVMLCASCAGTANDGTLCGDNIQNQNSILEGLKTYLTKTSNTTPNTIQNMRFQRQKTNCGTIPLTYTLQKGLHI